MVEDDAYGFYLLATRGRCLEPLFFLSKMGARGGARHAISNPGAIIPSSGKMGQMGARVPLIGDQDAEVYQALIRWMRANQLVGSKVHYTKSYHNKFSEIEE